MQRNTVIVQIAGREYTLNTAGSPEHAQRVAEFVDRKIRDTMSAGLVNRETAAVMAALTVAEELLASQDDNTRLRRKLDEMSHA